MEPVVSELEGLYAGTMEVRKVNVFDDPDVAEKYSIRVVPTLILEDPEGNILERNEGFMTLEDIQELLRKHGIRTKEGS